MGVVDLQANQEALQHAYREVQLLQKHRDKLQKQLADIASKINSGMIPDPDDLELPELQVAGMPPRECRHKGQDLGNNECRQKLERPLIVMHIREYITGARFGFITSLSFKSARSKNCSHLKHAFYFTTACCAQAEGASTLPASAVHTSGAGYYCLWLAQPSQSFLIQEASLLGK